MNDYIITGICIIVLSWLIWQSIRLAVLGQRAVSRGKATIPAKQIIINSTTRVLVAGDSTAFGVGASEPKFSLVGRLATDLPHVHIDNVAQNGLDLATLNTILTPHKTGSYDHLIIHIGGIDTMKLTPLNTIKKELSRIILNAQRIATGTIFIISVNNIALIPFFPFPLNHLYGRRSKAVSLIFSEQSIIHKVVHIPLYEEEYNDQLHTDPKHYFSVDGTHPSDAGYKVWYKKISQLIIPAINQTPHGKINCCKIEFLS